MAIGNGPGPSAVSNARRQPPRPLVVVPTFNERDNLERLVRACLSCVPSLRIWVIDDNSPDGTGDIADRLAAEDDRVAVVHRAAKLGLGTAYTDAFQRALSEGYGPVIQMDADLSHDPSYLPDLLSAVSAADIAIGSRYTDGGGTRNWPVTRRALSRFGNFVARVGLGIDVRDATSGFRAYSRSALAALELDHAQLRGYGFMIETIAQAERRGLTVTEVPIIFVERTAGSSKMTVGIAWEAFVHIARGRLDQPRGGHQPEVIARAWVPGRTSCP